MSSDFGITAKRSFAPALRLSLPVFPPPQPAIAIAMVTRAQIRLIHFSSELKNAAMKPRRHEEHNNRHGVTEKISGDGAKSAEVADVETRLRVSVPPWPMFFGSLRLRGCMCFTSVVAAATADPSPR